jgi:predicted nucleic acid-binding protein
VIYYFDASAFVKAFNVELGSERIIEILNSGLPIYSSCIIYPEILFTLRRKKEAGEIDEDSFKQLIINLDESWNYLNVINVSSVLNILREKVIKYSLKALDAIHLASAIWIKENIDEDCIVVCSDKELLKICKIEEFEIINPEEIE